MPVVVGEVGDVAVLLVGVVGGVDPPAPAFFGLVLPMLGVELGFSTSRKLSSSSRGCREEVVDVLDHRQQRLIRYVDVVTDLDLLQLLEQSLERLARGYPQEGFP